MHIVTAPLAVLADATGRKCYYYRDATLPEDLPAAEVARVVGIGLVAEVEHTSETQSSAEPGTTGPETTGTDTATDTASAETSAGKPMRPPQAGLKADWVAYRVATGQLTEEQAEAMSKQELIDLE